MERFLSVLESQKSSFFPDVQYLVLKKESKNPDVSIAKLFNYSSPVWHVEDYTDCPKIWHDLKRTTLENYYEIKLLRCDNFII